eukprot:539253-Ditylum_brightwellii.AAC.1
MSTNTVLLQATKNMSNQMIDSDLEEEKVKQKKDFSIKDVYEEEAKELGCDSDIDGEEIDDLHDMAHIAKYVKAMLKEEDDAVADEIWKNNVLIEKAGDMPTTCF